MTLDEKIIRQLGKITDEERTFLAGKKTIDRGLYMSGESDIINAEKFIASDKLITVRPNTRFVHFPEHTHDYVEIVYMCSGKTVHMVNGKKTELKTGELLFMNQHARHEVLPAGEDDIAVNFLVKPAFFTSSLSVIGDKKTPLHAFLADCICGKNKSTGYIRFSVSKIKPVQNLMENLIMSISENTAESDKINEITMSLLLLQLIKNTKTFEDDCGENIYVFRALRYIETNYRKSDLGGLCRELNCTLAWLSREIKRRTGKTYTELLQEKRLSEAAHLLLTTSLNVDEISVAVGYENISYFYRLFSARYNKSPRSYRADGKCK